MLQSQTNIQMQQIFNLIYPVGSVYFSTTLSTKEQVQNAFGGTWEKLPVGYAIWTTATEAGTTIAPGLPNITGSFTAMRGGASGAFWQSGKSKEEFAGGATDREVIKFDASRSSSIYGNSTTVQPPAYKVYGYKRLTLGA